MILTRFGINRFKSTLPGRMHHTVYKRLLSGSPESIEALRSTIAFPAGGDVGAVQPLVELGANTPVGWIENGLSWLHMTSGLSWGTTIIVGTVVMRAALIPFIMKGLVATSKMQAIKPQLTPIQERLQKAKKIGDKVAAQQETQNMAKIFSENKINPLSGLWGLVQIPVFISFFMAVNKMGGAQVPGFTTGGFGWLSNLSVPDPLYIAPVAVPVMAFGTIVLQEKVSPGLISPFMTNILLAGGILGLFFTVSLPASIYYYLFPSMILSGLQTLLVNNPRFRKAVGLPPIVKVSLATHDKPDTKSTAAVRPMKLSEAFKEARAAINMNGSSRTGTLNLSHASMQTPNFLTYTRIGSIPHLSPSLFSNVAPFDSNNLPLLIALQDFIFLTSETLFPNNDLRMIKKPKIQKAERFGGLRDYLRLSKEAIIIGELRDVYDYIKIHQDLEVQDDFAKVYTSRGGVGTMNCASYAKAVLQLGPDIVISMADANDPRNQGNVKKRLKRSLARTIKFLDILVESVKGSGMDIPVFATCVGGDDLETRRTCSQSLGERTDIDGYVIPLSQCSALDFKDRISSSLELLPYDKPKIVYGLSDFSQILYAISQGIDLFDGLIPYIYTTKGVGLDLKFNGPNCRCVYIDLNDPVFEKDLSPIDDSCSCHACKNHTKAYIHHLLKCKEMLAGILLITHNISASDRFMADVRASISSGSFSEDCVAFDSIFQELTQ